MICGDLGGRGGAGTSMLPCLVVAMPFALVEELAEIGVAGVVFRPPSSTCKFVRFCQHATDTEMARRVQLRSTRTDRSGY